MKRSPFLALAAVVFVAACRGDQAPTAPTPGRPDALIVDAAHFGPNLGFFFLPPIAKDPSTNVNYAAGTALTNQFPVIKITGSGADAACSQTWTFTRTEGHITVQTGTEPYYQFNWHTNDYNLDPDCDYKISVLLGVEVGYADVELGSNASELKNVNTNEAIPLVDGRTLPIKFRLQKNALASPEGYDPDPDSDFDTCEPSTEDCITFTVNVAAPGTTIGVTDDGGAGFSIKGNNEGLTTLPSGDVALLASSDEVTLTLKRVAVGSNNSCDPVWSPLFVRLYEGCYHIFANKPVRVATQGGVIYGSCLEISLTADEAEGLAIYKSDGADEPPEAQKATTGGFLTNCANFTGSPLTTGQASNRLMELAGAGWRALSAGVARLLSPQSLWAYDTSPYCELKAGTDLSYLYFGETNTIIRGTTSSSGTAGTAISPSVRIVRSHPTAATSPPLSEGVAGVNVTFTVTSGTGSVGGGLVQTVQTDANGYATASWIVGGGVNTLRASAQALGGEPVFDLEDAVAATGVSFSVTAGQPDLVITSGPLTVTPTVTGTQGGTVTLSGWTLKNQGNAPLSGSIRNAFKLSTDPIITASDLHLSNNTNLPESLEPGESFTWGSGRLELPAGLTPGTYYIGILTDHLNEAAESDEGNNYVSAPITVVLSGIGTATIDGIRSDGEWDHAGCTTFTAGGLPLGNNIATACLMNDATKLYMLVRFPRSSDPQSSVDFTFDGNGDGGTGDGDDRVGVTQNVDGIRFIVVSDEHAYTTGCGDGGGAVCIASDDIRGGTHNVVGTFNNDGTLSVFELSHPLNSSDDAHDVSLAAGQLIGYVLGLNIGQSELTGGLVRTFNPTGGFRRYLVSTPPGAVRFVLVTPTVPSILVGGTVQLTATAFDASGNPVGGACTWASAAPAVASVSTRGLVTGIAAGEALISATCGGIQGFARVTVSSPIGN